MIGRPPRSTLFPSPTLFRSAPRRGASGPGRRRPGEEARRARGASPEGGPGGGGQGGPHRALRRVRSEEHTSELQSRQYLVCRLLLEKKKKTIIHPNQY